MLLPSEIRRPFANWAAITLSPLRTSAYRAVWLASLVSNFGGVIQILAAAWLMVSLTSSPVMVALVQTAASLPFMMLSLLAGALADTVDRRRVMIGALLLSAVASTTLAVLSMLGLNDPWVLLVLTFFVGAGTALYGPAWQASVPELAPPEELPQAVALNSLNYNIARSVGPAIGAEIIAIAGVTAAFLVNALSYVGLIVVLARWRRPGRSSPIPPESLGRAMGDGIRYVSLAPRILAAIGRGFLFGLAGVALLALIPLLAKDLGGGPRTLGLLLGSYGIGAMAGALSSARLRDWLSPNGVVGTASLAMGVSFASLGAVPALWLAVLASLIGGAGWVLVLATLNVTVQLSSPRWVAGRAIAVYMMITFGGVAGGSALWGYVARQTSVPLSLACAGAVLLATQLLSRQLALSEARREDLNPQASSARPTPVEMDPRAGPVVLVQVYRVSPENTEAFVDAMHEMGRVRRRDGARHWSLMQDIDQPHVWVERYHSPTWLDHLRRISRPTAADALVRERVLRLCSEPPTIHRYLERPSGAAALGVPRPPEAPPPDSSLHG